MFQLIDQTFSKKRYLEKHMLNHVGNCTVFCKNECNAVKKKFDMLIIILNILLLFLFFTSRDSNLF